MEVKEIERLIEFITQSGLEEVHIETEQIKLSVKKKTSIAQTAATTSIPSAPTAPIEPRHFSPITSDTTSSHVTNKSYTEFKSPMVGTFYQASSPESSPFVQVGDSVKKGQRLCVIEAMKLFNEIESDVAGKIVEILVEDASPVAYDQPLFLIDTQPEVPSDTQRENEKQEGTSKT